MAVIGNRVVKNVGTELTEVLKSTAFERYTLIGLSLTNVTDLIITVDIVINGAYYLKNILLPNRTSLRAVSTGEKLVLGYNTKVEVRSSVADSVDVITSYAASVDTSLPTDIQLKEGWGINLTRDNLNDIRIDVDFASIPIKIAADDSTIISVPITESIKFSGIRNITTYSDSEGNLTIEGPDLSPYQLTATAFDAQFSSLSNLPTTLAGYGITDAATNTQGNLAESAVQPNDNIDVLNNNVNYTTKTYVDAQIAAVTAAHFDGDFTSLSNIPTTISGYGITDAFTGNVSDLLEITNAPAQDNILYANGNGTFTWAASVSTTLTGLIDVDSTSTIGQVLASDGDGSFSFQTFTAGSLTSLSDVDTSASANAGLVLTSDGDGTYSLKETLGDNQKFYEASEVVTKGDLVVTDQNNKITPTGEFIGGDILTPSSNSVPINFANTGGEEIYGIAIAYNDSDYTHAIAYKNLSTTGYGYARLGNIANNLAEYGNRNLFYQDLVDYISVTYLTNDRIAIAYTDVNDSNKGYVVVGTYSTSTKIINFGTPVEFSNGFQGIYNSITYDKLADVLVISYKGESNRGFVRLATATGNTVTLGYLSGISINTGETHNHIVSLSNLPGDGVVANDFSFLAYQDGATGYGYANLIWTDATGSSFSVGPHYDFSDNSGPITGISIAWSDALDRFLIAYIDGGNSSKGYAVLGSLSGSLISFGSPFEFDSGTVTETAVTYDEEKSRFVISYAANSTGKIKLATVDSNNYTIAFTDQFLFANGANNDVDYVHSIFDLSQNKTVVAYADVNLSNKGIITIFTSEVTAGGNANKFIGIADDDAAIGEEGKVNLRGSVDRTQTNLTPNEIYYVTADGQLSTTPTEFGVAGRALSATHIQLFPETSFDKIINLPSTFDGYGITDLSPIFTAHTFIRQGQTVALRSDGMIEAISASYAETAATLGNEEVFENTTDQQDIFIAYDNNEKAIITYNDITNNETKIVVVEFKDDGTIAVGNPIQIDSTGYKTYSTYIPNRNCFVVFYNGTARVIEIAGLGLNMQTPVSFDATAGNTTLVAHFDPTQNRIFITYIDIGDSNKAKAFLGEVDINLLFTYGTPQDIDNVSISELSLDFDTNSNLMILAYKLTAGPTLLLSASISGNILTLNTNDKLSVEPSISKDNIAITVVQEENKLIIAYKDTANTKGSYVIVDIVGNGFVAYPVDDFHNGNISDLTLNFVKNTQRTVFVYKDISTGNGSVVSSKLNSSKTGLEFGVPDVVDNPYYQSHATADLDNSSILIAYKNQATGTGEVVVYKTSFTTTISNADDYIGIAKENIETLTEGQVYVNGQIAFGQQNLIVNEEYFLAADGTLTVTQSEYGTIGRALTNSSLLLSSDSITQLYIDNAISNVTFSFNFTGTDSVLRSLGSGDTLSIVGDTNVYTQSANNGSLTIFAGIDVNTVDSVDAVQSVVDDNKTLKFDEESGFSITDLENRDVKISMASFRRWETEGSIDLVATGHEPLTWIPGPGIGIGFDNVNKTITFANTAVGDGSGVWRITGDDSTVRAVSGGQTIQFLGGSNIDTISDVDGNITIELQAEPSIPKLFTNSLQNTTYNAPGNTNQAGLYLESNTNNDIIVKKSDGTTTFTFAANIGDFTATRDIYCRDLQLTQDIYCRNLNATGDVTSEYTSDARLKNVLEKIDIGLDFVRNVDPVKYTWTDEAKKLFNKKEEIEIGLLAQEVEKYFPEIVKKKASTEFLSLDYQKITVILLAALKQMDNRIQELEKNLGI